MDSRGNRDICIRLNAILSPRRAPAFHPLPATAAVTVTHKSREPLSSAYWPTGRHTACGSIAFFIQDFYFSPVLTQTVNTPESHRMREKLLPSKVLKL